jgi:hypothetical protein
MAMSSISRKEYLREVRRLYRKAKTKKAKGELVSNVVDITGMHRKAVLRLLHRKPTGLRKQPETRGRQKRYDDAFHAALLICWHATNDICAERLQPFLPELVPKLEDLGELEIADDTRYLLTTASITTVYRHLKRAKRRSVVPLGTTKPGNLLKSQIAIRYGRWDEDNPGWLESDTVAHGGDNAEGQFIHSYDFVDIATAWTEQVATMGMGERATVAGLQEMQGRFPFPILGIDSDNGGEYINHHLYTYCKQERITFTRSRRYKKNDNAHVEQKNWEAIRKIVGYARLDTEEQLTILNELYRGPLSLYLNFFQPTRKRKLKETDQATGKYRKYYFEAMTPYQRVMAHPLMPEATKAMLQSEYNQLNPVKLLAEIRTLLTQLGKTLR